MSSGSTFRVHYCTHVCYPCLLVRKKTRVDAMSELCVMRVSSDLSIRVRTHTISCVLSSVFLEDLINIQQEEE